MQLIIDICLDDRTFQRFLYLAQIGTFFYEAIAMQRALSQQLISRVFWSVLDLVENLKVILRL